MQIGNLSLENILIDTPWHIKILLSGLFPEDLNYLNKHFRSQSKYVDPSIAKLLSESHILSPLLM